MWPRQITASILKNFRRGTHISSRSSTLSANGLSQFGGRKSFASQCSSQLPKWGSESVPWMLLQGQAALIIGGCCSIVFAEEVSSGIRNDAQESSDTGLQRVEDGSAISNEHTSKWRIFTDNGREFFMKGKLNEAEKFFSSALEEAKIGFGERDPHVASAYNNLAEFYRITKSYDKAAPLYLDAISILEQAYGSEDVRVGAALHNLGQFYLVQRNLQEARSCYERALKMKGRVLGHGHPDYADTMFHLGTVLYLEGNVNDAEVLIKDSIRILEEGGQGEAYSCIRKLRYLAKIYMNSKNRLEDAENVQRKILHIMELTKGWKSLDTVIAAENLTVTLQSKGQLRDTQELLERCLDMRKELLPEDHLQIGANMLGLANVILLHTENLREMTISESIAKLDRAKKLIEDSIRIAQKILKTTEYKTRIQNRKQFNGNNQHIALIVLLKSLKALANLEKTKHAIHGAKEGLPLPEAENALRQCMRAFKEYGAVGSTSTSVEPQIEYVSCMKSLLNLIVNATNNAKKTPIEEVEELEEEIRRVEVEISSHRTARV